MGPRSLDSRLTKLEDPRSPRERERAKEAARRRRELEARLQAEFEATAAAHPERVADYLKARAEFGRKLAEHGEGSSEVRAAIETFAEAQERFECGYVRGVECEDCGRAGERSRGGYEGVCTHCGGVVSWYGFWAKRVISQEKLQGEIDAARRMGYEANAQHLEALKARRLRDVAQSPTGGEMAQHTRGAGEVSENGRR